MAPVISAAQPRADAVARIRPAATLVFALIAARDVAWMLLTIAKSAPCPTCGVSIFYNGYGALNCVLPGLSLYSCAQAWLAYRGHGSQGFRLSATGFAAVGASFPGIAGLAPFGMLLSAAAVLVLVRAEPRPARPVGFVLAPAPPPPWQP